MRHALPAAMLLAAAAACPAAEPEVRAFAVSVDGRHAGEYRLTVRDNADGSVTAEGAADVTVRVLLFTYRYTYRGSETWKDGRLIALDCAADDNGTKTTVSAAADRDALRVTVNGRGRPAKADAWTTSYWQLPPGAGRQTPVTLLDCDSGTQSAGRLDHVGPARLMVGGRAVDAVRYRVTGGKTPADLWYDGAGRLVRQESVEDGHRTVLELRAAP